MASIGHNELIILQLSARSVRGSVVHTRAAAESRTVHITWLWRTKRNAWPGGTRWGKMYPTRPWGDWRGFPLWLRVIWGWIQVDEVGFDLHCGFSDAIWRHRTWTTLVEVYDGLLPDGIKPSPDTCWRLINDVLRHSPEDNFTGNTQDLYPRYESENH